MGARKECPLVVGVGEGEHFIASAIPAFLRETRTIKLVNDDEIVIVRPDEAEFLQLDGAAVERESEQVTWDDDAAEKTGYPTFMLKEIHEQPDSVADTLADRLVRADGVELGDIGLTDSDFEKVRRIVVVACGTSYHAGLVGRYVIEEWARLPVEMDIASEYRYRNPGRRSRRPGDRYLPVRGDRRHACGDAPRAPAGRHGAGDHEHRRQSGDP